MGGGSSWFDQQNKVGGTILNLGLVLRLTIPIGVLNIADGTEPREETVWDISGDQLARKEICHILIDEFSGGRILELCIEGFPARRLFCWGKDPLDDKTVSDRHGNFHFAI